MKISKAQIEEWKWKVRLAPEKTKPPKSNLTREDKTVIRILQINTEMIILPADTIKVLVMRYKLEYQEKLLATTHV